MRRLYFAYGSNLALSQFASRCPDSVPVAAARLPGWRLRFAGAGHADIVPEPGASVPGALYEVGPDDVAALDRYEGAHGDGTGYYERVAVRVVNETGERRRAFAYRMLPGRRDSLPSPFYAAVVLLGSVQWEIDPDPELLRVCELVGVETGVETRRPRREGRGAAS